MSTLAISRQTQTQSIEIRPTQSCAQKTVQWIRKCEEGSTASKILICFLKCLGTILLFASLIGIPLYFKLAKEYRLQSGQIKPAETTIATQPFSIQRPKTDKDLTAIQNEMEIVHHEEKNLLRRCISAKRKQVEEVDAKITVRSLYIPQIKQEIEGLKEQLSKGKEKCEELDRQIAAEDHTISQLTRQQKETLEETASVIKQRNHIKEQCKAKEKEIEALKQKNIDEIEKALQQQEQQLKEVQQLINDSGAEITNTKKKLEERKAEKERKLEEERKAQEKELAKKKAEEERIAQAKKTEEERIAQAKKTEEERIAQAKKAEEERIAQAKKTEDERKAEESKSAEPERRRPTRGIPRTFTWSNNDIARSNRTRNARGDKPWFEKSQWL